MNNRYFSNDLKKWILFLLLSSALYYSVGCHFVRNKYTQDDHQEYRLPPEHYTKNNSFGLERPLISDLSKPSLVSSDNNLVQRSEYIPYQEAVKEKEPVQTMAVAESQQAVIQEQKQETVLPPKLGPLPLQIEKHSDPIPQNIIASLEETPPLKNLTTMIEDDSTIVIRPVQYVEKNDDRTNGLDSAALEHWKSQTEKAITNLEKKLKEKKDNGLSTHEEEIRLRLLYLATDQYDKAVVCYSDTPEQMQKFWESECRGLAVLLTGNTSGATIGSAANLEQATQLLKNGLEKLQSDVPMTIGKILAVEAPAPFGLYEERTRPYHTGELLFIYAELENVVNKTEDKGEYLSIDCSWELYDKNGKGVIPREVQVCNNRSSSRLRDIVLNISIELPSHLPSGDYILKLAATDRNHNNPTVCTKELPIKIEIPK